MVNNVIQPPLSQPSKTEFIIIGLPAQIKKIPDPSIHLFPLLSPLMSLSAILVLLLILISLSPTYPANVSCTSARGLRRIRTMLDSKTPSTIATSIVHAKIIRLGLLQLPLSQSRLHPNTASAAYQKLSSTGHGL